MNLRHHLLNNVNSELLYNMLSLLGERPIPSRKADRAAALMDIWSASPHRILDGLSATERLLLACKKMGILLTP